MRQGAGRGQGKGTGRLQDASTESRLSDANGGKNAGRACWALAGTLCGGKVQGTFAEKLGNCLSCEFYQLVVKEEGAKLKGSRDILKML